MQLDEAIPSEYRPFYAGINAEPYQNVIRYDATGIHHPEGMSKKYL